MRRPPARALLRRPSSSCSELISSSFLVVRTKGTVLRADVDGQILMRAYLSGTPECKFGLNDKLVLEKASVLALCSLGRGGHPRSSRYCR